MIERIPHPRFVRRRPRSRRLRPSPCAGAGRSASCARCSRRRTTPNTPSTSCTPSASRDFERNFQRFAASARGRALLAERPSLLAALSDRGALARMPEGSLGRAYLAYLERNGFEPGGLLPLQHRVQERWEREEGAPRLDEMRNWLRDRSILAHDLFHVLTDYGPTTSARRRCWPSRSRSSAGAPRRCSPWGPRWTALARAGWRFLRYDFQAWRRGRRAASLVELPWEELLPLRLDTVRRLAGVADAEAAHPEGILVGRIVPRAAP